MYHSKNPRWAAILECRAKHDENKPQKSTHLEDFRINAIKKVQLNQQGNLLTENEEKNEIIEANYVWNIHITISSKLPFLNRDWTKLLPWIFGKLLSNLLWKGSELAQSP